jgi:hypothetical protein
MPDPELGMIAAPVGVAPVARSGCDDAAGLHQGAGSDLEEHEGRDDGGQPGSDLGAHGIYPTRYGAPFRLLPAPRTGHHGRRGLSWAPG